ncbi:hypothetical protein SERLA73DRAFT_187722 [Serpula lacrymans var. lacrymans S7.3]|uniref:Uncharacterized protein n=1 Tax=Serpula lacrymans var. lacrymans (strain S7.3) TaxID=936435 RepID=F8QA84_SERL3|nr:hypothetical protein SERLA73DRAFT_187722 [Serpula lacrymans var. lacrymans S7.3]
MMPSIILASALSGVVVMSWWVCPENININSLSNRFAALSMFSFLAVIVLLVFIYPSLVLPLTSALMCHFPSYHLCFQVLLVTLSYPICL